MTLPVACEGLSDQFKACISGQTFWGRLLGRCDPALKEFEQCLKREYIRKKRQSLKDSRAKRKQWEEANDELGIPNPAR